MVLASTIAIVESSASDRHRYRQYLNADRLLAVGSSGEGLELCARHQPEAIVLGDSIGDALEFLDRLQTTVSPPPAVVFVVSRSREALAARAFKAGARDYLIREEITPEALRNSIETAIAAGRPKIECDRVEAKLQVQEERFRSSVETMLDCFGIYTAMRDGHGQIVDFRIDYVNDAACLNNCMTAEEQIGRGLCEILPAHRDAGLFDAYCQVVETGQPFIKENIVYDDNYGQQRLARAFDIRVAKFGDGFVSTWRDISDRKQIEETLRKRETELRLVTDAVPALISFVDTDRRYRFANRGYENWFGRSAEAIEGKHLREVLGEPAYQEIRPWVDRVLAGEQVSFETQIPYRNGGSRYVKATYVPQFGKTGNVQGFVALVEDISDRKCAEAALRESEERFRTLAENISQFTWMADPTGWIFWYNQRWYDYTGTTLEQMQGWGWQQIHHPDYVDGVVEGFRHCIEAGEPWEDTFPLRGTDGTYRWFLSRALPIRDAQGDISRWFGTNTDITALKEAEEAIATSEERFRLAADGAHTGTWDIDLTTGEAVWSPRYFTILGYEPDPNGAASEQMWHDRLHPEDVDRVTREWQQARQERRRYRAEYRIIRADNQQVSWVVALGSFTYNRHGEAIRSTGVVLDINPRKQAEAALVRQERRYRHIFEAVGVSIWEEDFSQVKAAINELKAAGVDDIGEYCRSHPEFVRDAIAMVGLRDVNQASLYLFGAQTKEELLHSLDRIFTPETEETFIEELAAIAAGETRFAAETIVRTLRGDRLHILFSIAFPPPDEPYDRVLVSMFDISDRVAAEAERERLLESERSAREEAERANRVKDEFLAILSHELRSPLNPILGWSKLLQTRQFNREQIVSAAATIERNVKLQTQLVDDLLDLARILRGKLSLDPAPFNLTQVVEAAMETVKTAAVSKAIALQSTLPEVGQVFGDSARLQQVVWNLLSNAIKFTPKGGQVTVDLEEMDDRVRILVRDTGKGIKREFLPYLFEAFRQESSATTRQHGGLGLGLAIVYQLVEAHGGTIWADSPGEGMGATFTVELPLFDTATNCDRSGGLHDQNIDLSGIRILAVDDSSDTCELLKILLSEYGVEVTAATSAAEAIATFETLQPDVLISDIGMPEVDGYTLIQQIRALAPEKGGNIPAIALTAYAREDDRDRAIEWGYQCHIPKPLDPDRLVDAIVELIQ